MTNYVPIFDTKFHVLVNVGNLFAIQCLVFFGKPAKHLKSSLQSRAVLKDMLDLFVVFIGYVFGVATEADRSANEFMFEVAVGNYNGSDAFFIVRG